MNDTVNKNIPENDGGLDCKENLEKNKQDNFYTRKERILQQKKQYLACIKEKRLQHKFKKLRIKHIKARLKANKELKAKIDEAVKNKPKSISLNKLNKLRGLDKNISKQINKTNVNIKMLKKQRDER